MGIFSFNHSELGILNRSNCLQTIRNGTLILHGSTSHLWISTWKRFHLWWLDWAHLLWEVYLRYQCKQHCLGLTRYIEYYRPQYSPYKYSKCDSCFLLGRSPHSPHDLHLLTTIEIDKKLTPLDQSHQRPCFLLAQEEYIFNMSLSRNSVRFSHIQDHTDKYLPCTQRIFFRVIFFDPCFRHSWMRHSGLHILLQILWLRRNGLALIS